MSGNAPWPVRRVALRPNSLLRLSGGEDSPGPESPIVETPASISSQIRSPLMSPRVTFTEVPASPYGETEIFHNTNKEIISPLSPRIRNVPVQILNGKSVGSTVSLIYCLNVYNLSIQL